MAKLTSSFEIIDFIYDALDSFMATQTAEVKATESETREAIIASLAPTKERFERFFNWENVSFKPFEEVDQSKTDTIFRTSIAASEKIARYKALTRYIDTEYHGSALAATMTVFKNAYLALLSDSASGEALENLDSEYYPTSFGEFCTCVRGLPMLIPDPRQAHNMLIKHFDRTKIIGLVARNAIRDGYVYDASVLYKLIAIGSMFLTANGSSANNFIRFMNDESFFSSLVIPGTDRTIQSVFLTEYKDGFIRNSDTSKVRDFKTGILNSLKTFSEALATMVTVDFSFFYPFVVSRFIINANSSEEPFSLKQFKDTAQAMYREMLSFNEYVVTNA